MSVWAWSKQEENYVEIIIEGIEPEDYAEVAICRALDTEEYIRCLPCNLREDNFGEITGEVLGLAKQGWDVLSGAVADVAGRVRDLAVEGYAWVTGFVRANAEIFVVVGKGVGALAGAYVAYQLAAFGATTLKLAVIVVWTLCKSLLAASPLLSCLRICTLTW